MDAKLIISDAEFPCYTYIKHSKVRMLSSTHSITKRLTAVNNESIFIAYNNNNMTREQIFFANKEYL